MSVAGQPWGAKRLAPCPNTVHHPFTRTETEPGTQTALCSDTAGQRVGMSGGHGTNQPTSSPTSTGADGGGPQPPAPADALEDDVPD